MEKTDYYNHRVHWEFRTDEVKTPFLKLGSTIGRKMPENFSLSVLATGKRYGRTIDGQGRISWKRYRLYVRAELKHQRVEIGEFFDSMVVTYRSGTVVSSECAHKRSQISSIPNTPVFHEHQEIKDSPQRELFNLSGFEFRYVMRRPPYRRRHPKRDATQLMIEGVEIPKRKR